MKSLNEFLNEEKKTQYISLSKEEVQQLKDKGTVTKTFAGTRFSHKASPELIKKYKDIDSIEYKDWSSGKKVKANAKTTIEDGIIDIVISL
jgi:hypothetical protein